VRSSRASALLLQEGASAAETVDLDEVILECSLRESELSETDLGRTEVWRSTGGIVHGDGSSSSICAQPSSSTRPTDERPRQRRRGAVHLFPNDGRTRSSSEVWRFTGRGFHPRSAERDLRAVLPQPTDGLGALLSLNPVRMGRLWAASNEPRDGASGARFPASPRYPSKRVSNWP